MGATFGARLAAAGHRVTLLDVSKDAVQAINSQGLCLELKGGEKQNHRLPATTDPASVGQVDLVINFVKCYHTETAIRSVLPILGPKSAVLSLQNGWGNSAVIAGLVGDDRVFMGVTYHSATVLGPGHVLHAAQGNTFLGPLTVTGDRGRGRGEPIAKALLSAGLEVTLAEDVRKEIWAKLALNICTLPTSSLLHFFADDLVAHQGTLSLMRALLREGVAVARAQGIALDEDERWGVITGLLGRAGKSKSSMFQDVEKKRRTEIDVINGAIVAAGKDLGIPTPHNETMVWLVKSLEESFA